MMTSVADVEGVAAAGATGILTIRIPDPDLDPDPDSRCEILVKTNFLKEFHKKNLIVFAQKVYQGKNLAENGLSSTKY